MHLGRGGGGGGGGGDFLEEVVTPARKSRKMLHPPTFSGGGGGGGPFLVNVATSISLRPLQSFFSSLGDLFLYLPLLIPLLRRSKKTMRSNPPFSSSSSSSSYVRSYFLSRWEIPLCYPETSERRKQKKKLFRKR